MHVITAQNVNDAYRKGLTLMSDFGIPTASRNGPVLRVAAPVTTVYEFPTERVLFSPQRDANPFFHLFEALWMLDGNNDTAFFDTILPTFKSFSDDGVTFHGAYGYRWRHWPLDGLDVDTREIDQLAVAIAMLKKDPTSRRVVIGMWDPARDLNADSKDIPCNDLIKVNIVNGALDLTVLCRSNDMVWGAYGANAVHFTILQEYLAAMVGFPIGRFYQISADYHAYVEKPYKWSTYYPSYEIGHVDHYSDNSASKVFPLVANTATFDQELHSVVMAIREGNLRTHDPAAYSNPFFVFVVMPMFQAFEYYKRSGPIMAHDYLADTLLNDDPTDWLVAAREWLYRRAFKERTLFVAGGRQQGKAQALRDLSQGSMEDS